MRFRRWLEVSEEEFIKHHKTGWINPTAYSSYEEEGGLSWLGDKAEHPVLVTTKAYGPHEVEFRQSGEKLWYTATDEEGDIKRGPDGLALTMTDEEIKKKGLATHDQTIIAFVNEKPIGFVSNEFGTIGVWVEKLYQGLGIGSDLMMMFVEMNPRFRTGESKIGQMTDAGEKMSRAAYRKLVAKHGEEGLLPK